MSRLSPEIDCNHDNAHYNKCPDCDSITCDYCSDSGFKSMHGLKIHVCKMHREESSKQEYECPVCGNEGGYPNGHGEGN